MRWTVMILTMLWAFVPMAMAEDETEDGFESLFNGEDLSGWEGNPELWSVEDGAITGTTLGPQHLTYNQFLVWTGGEVGDFELRLEFRLEGDNNTGVQYRSARKPDVGEFSVGGYQADIHSNPPYTGMLYDEQGRGIIAERGQKVIIHDDGTKDVSPLGVPVEPVDLKDWHEMTIVAQGNHLKHSIDGIATVEVIDGQTSESDASGLVAFQVHRGPAMKAQFRNIRIKHLKKDGEKSPATSQKEESQKAPPASEPEENSDSSDSDAAAAPRTDANTPKWIWLNADQGEPLTPLWFRKEFTTEGAISAARLYVTCDDRVTVYLDGEEVLKHDTHTLGAFADVLPQIQKETPGGKHVLSARAENGKGVAGLVIALDLESGWRDPWSIVTDDSWSVTSQRQQGYRALDFAPNKNWQTASVVGNIDSGPWNMSMEKLLAAAKIKDPEATPVDRLVVAKDFQVELLYSVPKDQQGSWVSMCTDDRGRLIVCDQYGGLFLVTPPGIEGATEIAMEPIPADIGEAQGLLWAFDSLYVVVNGGGTYESGLYRVTDSDDDGKLDHVDKLRLLPGGGGEHGPHGVILSPDGQSIYVACGDQSQVTELADSRVPEIWDEDNLLPRIYGRGFMKGVPAPGGCVYRVNPEGTEWELVSTGFRNQYDIAFNADGELFTYDADMEWDINTPWYRPTRICHCVSGVDYGWRNGSAKFPTYFADTLPPVVNIGPGSPTGIAFGYGARFPAKYQQALFINDWSYGKLYAVHMQPNGSSYTADFEEFISGTPLPLTDIVVNPIDGAMYFAIGGRRVQSGLYRVTYTGSEATAAADVHQPAGAADREQRHKLEALHVGDHPEAVEVAWPYLKSEDRFLRAAARTAIELRPHDEWETKALQETDKLARLEALLALARVHQRESRNPEEAVDTEPPVWDENLQHPEGEAAAVQQEIIHQLGRVNPEDLTEQQKLATLRTLQLTMLRLGPPADDIRKMMASGLSRTLPAASPEVNAMILDILVYLQSEEAASKGVALLMAAPSQEEQIAYAKALRCLRVGWTLELQQQYFEWFLRAATYRGGANFTMFVSDIRKDALAMLSEEEKTALKPVLEQLPQEDDQQLAAEPRPFVHDWTFDELLPLVQNDLHDRDFDNGRKMFAAANCFACHRFNSEGGAIGPDLTGLAGRFDARAILESVLEPSKVISDQYAAVQIITIDGRVVVGRIVNLAGDGVQVNTDMMDPNKLVGVDRKLIDQMMPSKSSMMPNGLLNTLNREEVLDLMAFLLSRGDRQSPMFQPAGPGSEDGNRVER